MKYTTLKFIFNSLLLAFILLKFTKIVYANYIISESFDDGQSLSALWTINNNEGIISYTNNTLNIFSLNKFRFPYIHTNTDIFPTDKGTVSFDFKFNNIGTQYNYGAGIIISSVIPSNNTSSQPGPEYTQIGIWPLQNNAFHIRANICKNTDILCQKPYTIYTTTDENDFFKLHNLKIIYENNMLKVYLDTNLIFESANLILKPKYIWMGNTIVTNTEVLWPSISLDNIIVETSTNSTPIVLIPGMTACWNPVLLTGGDAENWYRFPIAFQLSYDPLINSLKYAGLSENDDFYVFCYDWRKPIEHNKDKLTTYIQEKIGSSTSINIVGHSMGGLIARAYTQANSLKVDKFITAGSPHQGAAEAFYAYEGGVILDKNPWSRLAKEIVLDLKTPLGLIDRHTVIQNEIPSLKDIFPTYDFLVFKDDTSQVKYFDDMVFKNSYLLTLNNALSDSDKSQMRLIYGDAGINTIDKIKTRNTPDTTTASYWFQTTNMWKDGEPDRLLNAPNEYEEYFPSYIFSDGDDTVTINSAVVNGVENYMIAGSHGETISDQNAINQILTWLDVNYTIQPFDDITLEKIIALILHSPVNMSVENAAGQTVGYQSNPNQQIPLSFYDETAKIIIIGNPEDALKIKLVGESGIENQAGYDLAVLSENKMDNLEKYLLSDTIGPDEEKEYLLDTKKGSLNKEGDSSTPSFSSLKIKITNMINQIETADYLSRQQKKLLASSLSSTLAKIDLLEKYSKQKKYTTLNSQLNIIQSYLFRTRRLLNLYSKNSEYEKEMLKINQGFPDIFSDLFFIKLASLKQKPCYLSKKYLKLKLWQNEILFTVKKKKIERDAAKNHAYLYQSASLFLAENYFQKANHYSDNDKIEEALFYSELSRWFLGEI